MLRRTLGLVLTLAAMATALATGIACSSSDLGNGDAMADANGIGTVDGDGPPGQDAAPPPPTTSYLRLAQLAPEIGSVDLCYRTKGAQGFTGPLLVSAIPSSDAGAPEGGALDAGPAGVSFGTVSPWVPIAVTGALDVALVPAGDVNCSGPRLLGQVTVDTGKRMTLVAMGTTKGADAGPRALGLESFVDDAIPHAQTTRVRVIHGALGTANAPGWGTLSVSVAYGNQVDPLATNVQPRHASTPSNVAPVVDPLGYNERAPVGVAAALRFVYGADGGANVGPWSTKPVDLGLAPSTVITAFLLSLDYDLGALVCNDLPSSGAVSCQLLRAK